MLLTQNSQISIVFLSVKSIIMKFLKFGTLEYCIDSLLALVIVHSDSMNGKLENEAVWAFSASNYTPCPQKKLWSLYFGNNYYKSSSNSKNDISFKICMFSALQNCPKFSIFLLKAGFKNWPRFEGVIEQNKISNSYENYCTYFNIYQRQIPWKIRVLTMNWSLLHT